MYDLVTLVLGILLLLLLLLYRKRVKARDVFIKMGIPGPKPHWLWGNCVKPESRYLLCHEWTKKYGKFYGFYEGPDPWLVTSDLDFIHEIAIKQYSNFPGRQKLPLIPDDQTNHQFNSMFLSKGKRWKRLRSITNPTFSTSKLRQISVIVNEKIDVFIDKLSQLEEEGKPINMQSCLQQLTLDVMADAGFGLNIKSQTNPEERFLKELQKFLKLMQRPYAIAKISIFFPELTKFLFLLFSKVLVKVAHFPDYWIMKQFESVIKIRRQEKTKRRDLLQYLLDARDRSDETKNDNEMTMAEQENLDNEEKEKEEGNYRNGTRPSRHHRQSEKYLTDEEMKSQCFLFLLAGYDTTSTTLIYMTYLMALYPEKQRLLQQEIDSKFPDEAEIAYDAVMKLEYLDMCVQETLRLFPVASTIMTRRSDQDCVVNGLHIPKGVTILPDIWTIHHDPEIWGPTNPWIFEPERFSQENKVNMHPVQRLAFGAGPKNCVGMRLALLEIKMTMVKVLRRFTFKTCELTEVPLQLEEAGTVTPVNPVYVTVESR